MLARDLASNPDTCEKVWVSVISFNNTATQVCSLTEVERFEEPKLVANGTTELGLALRELARCIDAEVRKRTPQQRGDYKPVIFLLTDGRPTDTDWLTAAAELRQRPIGDFVACAAGADADQTTMSKIADTVVSLHDTSPEALRSFMRWVSQSVEVHSRSAEERFEEENRPALPAGAELVGTSLNVAPSGEQSVEVKDIVP
jgi:uncharacterized protein YegL